MHRIHRSLLAAIAAGLVLLGAGCGGPESSAPTAQDAGAPAAAGGEAGVAWIDTVCGSMLELSTTVRNPQVDTSSPQATFKSYSAFIGSYISGIDEAVQTTEAAGPSPIAGGDEMLKGILDPLKEYRTKLEETKAVLDEANASDPASVTAATNALQVLKSPPAFNVPSTPELTSATTAAKNCQALQELGKQSATPSAAPSGG
ncbi:hypothetical protein SAMN05443637_10696 [Pseudonocardia thermophila]|jgi:hypothetical protein|uniref:Small secreted protein n=1 Tax=Pseudonocardia thermophila TaxID=1848 RepID=A0A1M6SEQ8_PSETH|nr:hypothetical protein [Pseudonocardia thermophila]SHK42978.1 hypothetical protein SAMN05443637_10696 [Pseudonocardia thermophila]